jgi:polyhydroxyalkanoate synthesis regulator phasin
LDKIIQDWVKWKKVAEEAKTFKNEVVASEKEEEEEEEEEDECILKSSIPCIF